MDLTVEINSSGVGERWPSAFSENNLVKASGVPAHCKDNCSMRDRRMICGGVSFFNVEIEVEIRNRKGGACFAVMGDLFDDGGTDTPHMG